MLLHTYIPTYHYFLTIRAVVTVPCFGGRLPVESICRAAGKLLLLARAALVDTSS